MQKTIRALAALVVVGLIAGVLPALAQEQAQSQSQAVAQGELVRVDAKTSTLIIKAADGAQMQFRYTEQTKVTGSDEKVAGLATMTGATLTIRYTQQQQEKVATEIAVQKSK